MRKRTRARELALQALYQIDIRGRDILDEAISSCITKAEDDEVTGFASELVRGCQDNTDKIDEEITSVVENWDLPGMAVIDRCILRMAVYELLFRDDIPPKVSVNEAIDLAKKYSTENSGAFVNGILDKVYISRNSKIQEYAKAGPEDPPVVDYGEADLHVHTSCSDGTSSPHEVVEEAARIGLKTIAITDHDTIDGVLPAQKEALKRNVHVIPGVEVSGYVPPYEIHILGLFIDIDDRNLTEKLIQINEERVARLSTIVEKLRAVNVNIETEDILRLAGSSPPGRMHVAEVLIDRGYCSNIPETFNKYIGDDCPAYVPKITLTPEQAIELIHGAGGVSVYAHPGLSRKDGLIPLLVESGLQAIEVYYPSYPPDIVEKYLGIAKKYNLIPTGGSDFHGSRKPNIPLGMIRVSNDTVHALRDRCKQGKGVLTTT